MSKKLTPQQRMDREVGVVVVTIFLLAFGGMILIGLLR